MKWLHMYLEHNQKKNQNPNRHIKTQVRRRPRAALGSTVNTDWGEREGGKEKALITPKTPSTNKAVAKAITSTDPSCFRDAALQPRLQQPPRAWVPEDFRLESDPGSRSQKQERWTGQEPLGVLSPLGQPSPSGCVGGHWIALLPTSCHQSPLRKHPIALPSSEITFDCSVSLIKQKLYFTPSIWHFRNRSCSYSVTKRCLKLPSLFCHPSVYPHYSVMTWNRGQASLTVFAWAALCQPAPMPKNYLGRFWFTSVDMAHTSCEGQATEAMNTWDLNSGSSLFWAMGYLSFHPASLGDTQDLKAAIFVIYLPSWRLVLNYP